jgi:hypothetical protein
MRLLQRARKDQADAAAAPAPPDPLAGRSATTTADGRTDLTCLVCGKTIAFGIREGSLAEDVRFFHEQHAGFCMRAGS